MRSGQQAVLHAQSEIRKGRKWVVDLDLDSFFDRVNHDRLMHKLKAKINDKPLLRLINRYLKSGVSIQGQYQKTVEGVPQGSPLSPLLSNIVLDELDWKLDKWIRRKLRCYLLKQWGRSGYRKLRALGIGRRLAWNTAKSAHGA